MKNVKKVMGFVLLVILFQALSTVLCFAAEDKGIGKWQSVAYMSAFKSDFQSEVLDGKIYVIGGNANGIQKSMEVYDPTSNKWTSLAPMSTARWAFQTEVMDGKIYAIGGRGEANSYLNTVEVYNPITNKWTSVASMSAPRCCFQTEVVNGKIYAIGGSTDDTGRGCKTAEVYDPVSNTWASLTSMSTPRCYFQTEVINNKIYAIGGGSSSLEVYDIALNKWSILASMSYAKQAFPSGVIDGKIYAISNQVNNTPFFLEVYDPTINSWKTLSSMPKILGSPQAKIIKDKIYVLGGYDTNSKYSNSVEVYDSSTNSWAILPSMSVARASFQTQVLNDKLYAIGGYENNSVEVFTPATIELNAPTNLIAKANSEKVDLQWDIIKGADGYNIKRSETLGGPYDTIYTSVSGTAVTLSDSSANYLDTTVKPGKTYYYVVGATASGKESPNSNEVSITLPVTEKKLKLVLEINENKQLSISDELGDNTAMLWSSSASSVALIDEYGKIKALKVGNTIVTCKSKDGTYLATIHVLVVDLENQLAVDLKLGEKCRLTADDLTTNTTIIWNSYDPTIATVNAKGRVTAVSEGLTYVTALDEQGKEIGRIYVRVRK